MAYQLQYTWRQVEDALSRSIINDRGNKTLEVSYSGTKPTRSDIEAALLADGQMLPRTNRNYLMTKQGAPAKVWQIAFSHDSSTGGFYALEKLTVAT